MKIRFRPINKVRRQIKGRLTTVMHPKYIYKGVKFTDGSILGESPMSFDPIELTENDVLIEEIVKSVPKNI